MNKTNRPYQGVKMGVPDVNPQQKSKPDDVPTENAKPETSSSSSAANKDEVSSPDLCSSKSVSERGKETDPQLLKQATEELKPVKTEQPSSAAMKEEESSRSSRSEKESVGGSPGKVERWDPNDDDVWLHVVNNHHN